MHAYSDKTAYSTFGSSSIHVDFKAWGRCRGFVEVRTKEQGNFLEYKGNDAYQNAYATGIPSTGGLK